MLQTSCYIPNAVITWKSENLMFEELSDVDKPFMTLMQLINFSKFLYNESLVFILLHNGFIFLILISYVPKKTALQHFLYTMHRSEYVLRTIKHKCVLYNLLPNFSIYWTLAGMEFYLQLRDKWLDRSLRAIFGSWTLFFVQVDKFIFYFFFVKLTRHFRINELFVITKHMFGRT